MKKLLLFLLIVFSYANLTATEFTVTNLNDAGIGSLRQAITDANADITATAGTPNVINIQLSGTIFTNAALPDVNNHMIINGPSLGITIKRSNAILFYRIFTVNSFVVQMNNLTMTMGDPGAANPGGAIMNSGGILTLNNCVLDNNQVGAVSGGYGGAIYQSFGTLNINNATLKNNGILTFCRGGAINIEAGIATLTNCTLYNNQTGGGFLFNILD